MKIYKKKLFFFSNYLTLQIWTLKICIHDISLTITARVDGGIWPKLELIQAFMHVLVTYKNEEDSYKNEGARVTLQEMCCGFLLSREMWYRKSVLPGTGAG